MVLWVPIAAVVRLSWTDYRYTHITVIPFISLGLMYLNRKAIFDSPRFRPGAGLTVLALVVAVYGITSVLPAASNEARLTGSMMATVLLCIAGFIFCYGVKASNAAAFPLGLLFLAVPLPVTVLERVTLLLREGSADLSYALFKLIGVPVFRRGFEFALPGVNIEVAEQCSGIRSSLALSISSMVAAHLFLRSTMSKVALIAYTVPVVIVKNALRIVTISYLGIYVHPDFLHGWLHKSGGIPFSLLAVALILPVLVLLQKIEGHRGTRVPLPGRLPTQSLPRPQDAEASP